MSNSAATLIYTVIAKYVLYSDIFLLTIGLISNLSLILIFVSLRAFRGNQCAFYLMVESIANIGVLLSNLPSNIFTYVNNRDPTVTSIVWCKIKSGISQIFGLGSLFTICFLTFDQYMSTNPRPNWRQISTLKLAHRLTFSNVCFVVLHSIPFIVLSEINSVEGCTIYNVVLHAYFTYFYYPVLNSAIPLLVTITFSLLAYRNVRRIIRRQIAVDRRRLDRQLTAMVLARVCCLIVFGLPYVIFSLYRVNISIASDNQMELAIVSLLAAIIYSFLYLNFSINFFVFLIVSARFRRQVKHFLVKKCWKLFLHCLCCMGFSRRNRTQVVPSTDHRDTSSVEST